MTAIETLKAAAAKQNTDTLMGALAILDAKPALDECERMTFAAIAEVVEDRENLTDAMDAIFDTEWAGTYFEAMLAAQAVTA